MGPFVGQITVGIGSYDRYNAASGALAKGAIAMADSLDAVNEVTANGTRLAALTWDSFVRRMGTKGYPAAQIIEVRDLAWPFIPQKYRDRLSKREAPQVPTVTTPPSNAPVYPSKQFPNAGKEGLPWWAWALMAAAGVGVGGAVVYKVARR